MGKHAEARGLGIWTKVRDATRDLSTAISNDRASGYLRKSVERKRRRERIQREGQRHRERNEDAEGKGEREEEGEKERERERCSSPCIFTPDTSS